VFRWPTLWVGSRSLDVLQGRYETGSVSHLKV